MVMRMVQGENIPLATVSILKLYFVHLCVCVCHGRDSMTTREKTVTSSNEYLVHRPTGTL